MILNSRLGKIKEEAFRSQTGLNTHRKLEESKIHGALDLERLCPRGVLILHACNKSSVKREYTAVQNWHASVFISQKVLNLVREQPVIL